MNLDLADFLLLIQNNQSAGGEKAQSGNRDQTKITG